MPTRHTLTPLARALVLGGALGHGLSKPLLGGLLTLACASMAQAQDYAFSIPAQPLSSALAAFGQQAQVQILYRPEDVQGKRSTALNGSRSAGAGIAELLRGTGLSFTLQGDSITLGTTRSGADQGIELGATNIDSRTLGASTEDTGSYTTGTMRTATKLPLSIRETPQAVSVITRQQMDDQNLTTVQEAVSRAPGLTMQKIGPERYTFYARGSQISNMMYDGLPTLMLSADDAVTPANLAMYDHIEITRGATGLVQGAGTPSAAINLVRKRPTADPRARVSLSAGSWDNYRGEFDVSGPLNDSKTLRGRTVVTYQDRNSFMDTTEKEHSLFYSVGEADIGENTTVTVGASYQNENNNVGWNGLPVAANGADYHLSRSRNFAGDWEYWDKRTQMLFVDIEHRLDNDWKLRLAGSKSWSDQNYLGSYPGRLSSNVGSLSIRASGGGAKDMQSSYDFFASGPFQFLGRTHELVIGANKRVDDYFMNSSGVSNLATNINPYTFDAHSTVKPTLNLHDVGDKRDTTQEGVYTAARFSVTDRLKFILGARLDWYDYTYDYNFRGDQSTTTSKATRHPTRYAGALYDLDEHHTIFASYTDIFQPQTYRDTSNSLLEPVEGENYEIGIKGEYFGGALNTSFSVFEVMQRNRGTQVDDQTTCASYPTTTCYEAAGKVRTQGIDMEISGALTPNWQLSAGYTFSQARYRTAQGNFQRGDNFDTDLPSHQFKLATMYKLPGELERWRVGGSFYSQSSIYNKGTTAGVQYQIDQPSYYVVDLMAGFQATKQLDLRFALNNVFDKKYYQTISQNTSSWPTAFYGDPRNFQVTASYEF
ncbi:TonB-dependent siderophore receptor [Pseudomonas sp. DTU_2021_1001937_2_SI_NGA_ILE_001]|uniref:TonB-dependent siderophore receptor n=1 Tax=Pseudomonas sp. DTU_2021_1001937_2_SI_NGA_ILE_001 TaxID=3077589 RepID=UPI0028FC0F3F|nr:TonB-dependent siderophore receptor [Pseudomonas sp. DTU_2021_1001937_2_SI_NGA_ILE_001]WNW11878.1 TonB-dependent siderophore receptor [Pseudomonas sp. DTU_2021_1001937_2_SI_NGA_ILE_001]